MERSTKWELVPAHFGPLWSYIEDDEITDIDFNGTDLWVTNTANERKKVEEHGVTKEFIEKFSHYIANNVSKPFNKVENLLEADTDTLRISIVHESSAISGRSVCIRKTLPTVRMTRESMITDGYCTKEIFLTQMLAAISKAKTGETTSIGSFHRFELLVEKNFMGTNYMVLRGKTEYKTELSTSPVGSMIKLENLFNGLHENVEFLEKKIEQYHHDLDSSKEEYEKPFAYEKELQEKLTRQFELNTQLDLENAKVADADLGVLDESKDSPDSNVAERDESYRTNQDGKSR